AVAEHVDGFRDRITAYLTSDPERRLPLPGFLSAPPALRRVAAAFANQVLADGSPAPAFYSPPAYTTEGAEMIGLQARLQARGWLSGHQDTLAGGARRTTAVYSHPELQAFVDATADTLLEAHALAALATVPEEARAAGGFRAVLVSRVVLEEDADTANTTIAAELAAPWSKDVLAPAMRVLKRSRDPFVLLTREDGIVRAEPVPAPSPGVAAGDFVGSLAEGLRGRGHQVGTYLHLLVWNLADSIGAVAFTRCASGTWSPGAGLFRYMARPPVPAVAVCRYCGCNDLRACLPDRCVWLDGALDRTLAIGVCTTAICVEAAGRERAGPSTGAS
ncbi:MAG TPA: hypothetical protein VF263_13975, partial [Longimicrobiaceae bacterium]